MNVRRNATRVLFAICVLLSLAGGQAAAEGLPDPAGQATAQAGPRLESMWRMGGEIRAVAVAGDYAFAAESAELAVIDLRGLIEPSLVASLPIPWIVRDVGIADNKAYLAGDEGLLIVDILHPLEPTRLGSFPAPAAANLSLAGDLVFLALGEQGLLIVDASDPAHPVQAGAYAGAWTDVWAQGNRAYLVGQELHILDVSDPARPALLGVFADGGPFQAVQARGPLIFLGASYDLLVVDAADPTSPALIGNGNLNYGIQDLHAEGEYVYLLGVIWNNLNSTNGCQMDILDVSNPSDPALVAGFSVEVSPTESCAGHLQREGDRLVVANGQLQVMNVSDPAAPWRTGDYYTLRLTDVAAVGSFIYLTSKGQDLVIFETSEPSYFFHRFGLYLGGWPEGLELAGPYLLAWGDLPSHPHFPAARLNIVDVRDPNQPVIISSYRAMGIGDLSVDGSRIYLVDGRPGFSPHLEIVDFSNPAAPLLAGEYGSTAERAEAVSARGDTVYLTVSDYPSGENRELRLLDAGDPGNIALLGALPVDFVYELRVAGDLAYAALGQAGLQVIDVGDPAHPAALITYPVAGGAWDVRVAGSVATIAAGGAGVQVVDFSDPLQPRPVASGEVFAGAWNLAVWRDLVYVSAPMAGLEVLRQVIRTSAEIGSGGGKLESLVDNTTYKFPAGAFDEPVTVIHDARAQIGLPDVGELHGIQHAFENAAISASGDPIRPLAPYALTIQYSQVEVGATIEPTLGLYYWDGDHWGRDGWVLEPSAVVDTARNTITASPDRFGLWAVLGETNRLYFPLVGGR